SDQWNKKAVKGDTGYNALEGRNSAVIRVIHATRPKTLLDIGCGTGQLVISAAGLGVSSTGIDFAESMIELCRTNAALGTARTEFIHGSVFDHDFGKRQFTLVSALGLIEYFSFEEFEKFLEICGRLIESEGTLMLGSRNRLFNLHSYNEYTDLEHDLGNIPGLFDENLRIMKAPSQGELLNRLRESKIRYRHPDSHPRTEIGVETRYQYSPAEILQIVEDKGFEAIKFYPVHYHAMPAILKGKYLPLHSEFSRYVDEYCFDDFQLLPSSSSFVAELRKT
ncbi:MAG TPA: methyltransferase domain-containing protein, partial [Planctomycetaceae bacterium]|nr:methyltransferase domain-containing protein [Planctomycetaceae bacterium]